MKISIRYLLQLLLNFSLFGLFSLLTYLSWSSKSQEFIKMAAKTFQLTDGNQSWTDLSRLRKLPAHLFELRRNKIDTLCQGVNVSAISPPRNLLYSKRMKVLYCPVSHTASTAIKYAMLKVENIPIRSHKMYQLQMEQGIHTDAQQLGIRPDLSQLSSSMDTLLLVRDPWQRLLSSYRELLYDVSRKHDLKWCMDLLDMENVTLLSFDRYLDCVLAMRNRHKFYFESVTSACSLCKVKYNKIVRFENLYPELNTVFDRRDNVPGKDNSMSNNYKIFLRNILTAPVRRSGEKDIEAHLRSVSKSNCDKIHDIYKNDFIFFGYTLLPTCIDS